MFNLPFGVLVCYRKQLEKLVSLMMGRYLQLRRVHGHLLGDGIQTSPRAVHGRSDAHAVPRTLAVDHARAGIDGAMNLST